MTTLRPQVNQRLERYRSAGEAGSLYGRYNYLSRSPKARFSIVCRQVGEWDVVSVAVDRKPRRPTLDELQAIKNLFWHPERTVQIIMPSLEVKNEVGETKVIFMWCSLESDGLPTADEWRNAR